MCLVCAVTSYPYPEEPDAHIADARHRGEHKVDSDDGDQDVVQRENLRGGGKGEGWAPTLSEA